MSSTSTIISTNPVEGNNGDTITISATLTTTATPPVAVEGETLDFLLDDKIIGTVITDINGVGILTYTITETNGTYPITIQFLGDTTYTSTLTNTYLLVTQSSLHYANEDEVRLRLKSIKANLDDNLVEDGLNAADDIINSTVPGILNMNPIDPRILRAATYYAAMDIVDIMFTNNANRNSVATSYETRAKNILTPFI